MYIKVITFFCLFVTLYSFPKVHGQEQDKMEWWHDAKFGMFIHFGVYAQYGGVYQGHRQFNKNAEWILNRCKIPVQEYKATAGQFNPSHFDANAWVRMAKDAGMKYLIITAKHHDGFALFDSQYSDWDIIDATPYKKDIIAALSKACKEQGLRFGVYYSQSQDWINPGGLVARKLMKEGWPNPDSAAIDAFSKAHQGKWDSLQLQSDFATYVRQIAAPQVNELITKYDNIDVFWWDTHMGIKREQADLFHDIVASKPHIITHDRLSSYHKGDTKTPEQHIPDRKQLDGTNWEVCMTMNGSWGYHSQDHDWKSPAQMLYNLVDIVSKGGNYLLNIGPDPTGVFPSESVTRLQKIGQWMKQNGEAIYGADANPLHELPWDGRITSKVENKKTILYVHILKPQIDGIYVIPDVPYKVKKARLLSGNKKVKVSRKKDNITFRIAKNDIMEPITVVKLEVEGYITPISHNGKGMNSGALD
jgi:alpha-L-fucosidase